MKLVIQIPCFNEAQTLPVTLASLPRHVSGFHSVEWLVIDDGSTDGTSEVARTNGVDYIVQLPRNQGLARAFTKGLDASLEVGADVIVNLDADNQYVSADISKLVRPILAEKAEIVIGSRPIEDIEDFTPLKKFLQRLGSWVVRVASGTAVPDAPSGFRALTRSAARKINVFSDYTYTLETLIQAGQKNMAVVSVPIRTNQQLRPSRLVKSTWSYVRRSALTIVRIFMTYRPFEFFAVPGTFLLAGGFGLGLRFLYFYITTETATGHVQSVVLAALLLAVGSALVVIGLVADLISVNRKLMENLDDRLHDFKDHMANIERKLDTERLRQQD